MSETINVSLGTAGVLGLMEVHQVDPPTTAYLMLGGNCARDCAFCAQARTSRARTHALSRVIWPPLPLDRALEALASAYERGEIQRCCLQITASPENMERATFVIRRIREISRVPLSVSAIARSAADIESLLDAGVDRVGLALDAASPELLCQHNSLDWEQATTLLQQAASRFPGRISSHLIIGLGETEEEAARTMQWLLDQGITVGLFAFTPVPGTRMADHRAPDLAAYRRLQIARSLMNSHLATVDQFEFDDSGRLISTGVRFGEMGVDILSGNAFRTSGCRDCNRPYYNERPGSLPYNYARPLTRTEARQEMERAFPGLTG